MAAQIVTGKTESEIRAFLGEYLKSYIEGRESIAKTTTVMMRLWFFPGCRESSYRQSE